jgi:hypothetical protein
MNNASLVTLFHGHSNSIRAIVATLPAQSLGGQGDAADEAWPGKSHKIAKDSDSASGTFSGLLQGDQCGPEMEKDLERENLCRL